MTQPRLIKQTEVMRPEKPERGKVRTADMHTNIRDWVTQYQKTKPRPARAAFAVLFAESQHG